MKIKLLTWLLLASAAAAFGQGADPLEATLPNGKIVHFQTAEQKARFEAAQARKAAAGVPSRWSQPTPEPTPTVPRAALGSSLDAPSSLNGIVNPSAPPFTANYYLLAPASWVGKKVTLAVAYLQPRNEAERADSLVQMLACTYNTSVTTGGDMDHGGYITVLAKPAVATRLMQQCGTTIQYSSGWRIKVTMIHGQIDRLENVKSEGAGEKPYGLFVDN